MSDGALGREYRDGEIICREGDAGDCMYVVQAGRAIVFREEGTRRIEVGELTTGDVFGEMAIFEQRPRAATVQAAGPIRVLTLDRRTFLRAVHEDPSLAYRMLQLMSHRIRGLNEEIVRLQALVRERQEIHSSLP